MDGVGVPTGEQTRDSDGRYEKRALWACLPRGPERRGRVGPRGGEPVTPLNCSTVSPTPPPSCPSFVDSPALQAPDSLHPSADTPGELQDGRASFRGTGARGGEGVSPSVT